MHLFLVLKSLKNCVPIHADVQDLATALSLSQCLRRNRSLTAKRLAEGGRPA
jgi:hypothetical protein